MKTTFAPLLLAATLLGGAGDREKEIARWREDLAFLAKELPARHKNLFFAQPKEEWEAKVAELDEAIGRLEDDEIVVEFMRLVASVGDGHTAVQFDSVPMARKVLPLQVHGFPDGLRVVLAQRELASLLGARVVAIGGVAIDEAVARVHEAIAHDNAAALEDLTPPYLESPFVLHGLGLAESAERATFRFELADGSQREESLAAVAQLGVTLPVEAADKPFWRQRNGENYWFCADAARGLFYLQYNRCADDPQKPFAALIDELAAAIEKGPFERLFVDLRGNGGGDSRVIQPLCRLLLAKKALREKGRLFVAIGPRTFSSAMMNAVELRQGFGAVLVGTPTGGKPNAYGEILPLTLPDSKLRVTYSTKLFKLVDGDPPSVLPDVEVATTLADWKSGRDPLLEAALAWKPETRAK